MPATKYPLTWDLDSLHPHPQTEEFHQLFDSLRMRLEGLASRSNSLPALHASSDVATDWCEFLDEYVQVTQLAEDMESFVGCHAAADAENQLFQTWEAKLSALAPVQEQIGTNVEFALKDATDEVFHGFLQSDARLEQVEFFLRESREHASFRLPKAEELLASELAVDGIHAWSRLYDRISGKLRIAVMERGEVVQRSVGQVSFDSPQRSVRENNFFAANHAWDSIADTCAAAINHIAGTRLTLYGRLDLPDHLALPCHLNRMDRKTLDVMWDVVTERRKCLLPYLQQKAKALGLKQLAWYDISSPFPGTRGQAGGHQINYEQACRWTVQAFEDFSPELGRFAQRALTEGWIEAENRSGKRQGGFCTDFPTRQQSRIFMTYTDTADSLSTLAHELGHAYHSFVLRDQPGLLTDYPYNLAETASTFAETVLGEQRLAGAAASSERLWLLDTMLSDAVAFVMNLHARFIFEDKFHVERANGELRSEELSAIMLDAQRIAYEDALDDDGWNPSFWISKLHFYISEYPFYNFPYTFGYLLSLGIYSLGARRGEEFAGQFREFLIATGCQPSEQAVQSAFGCDLRSSDFWNMCMDVVEQRVQQFVSLV